MRTFLLGLSALTFFAPSLGAQRTPVTERAESAAVETFPVEFEFATVQGSEKEPRGGVELVLGVGHAVDPQHHIDRAVLTRVVSGADGVARGVVDVPVEWKRDGAARLWARVASPEYAWCSAMRTLSPKDDERITKLYVRRGGRLLGTVRTESGSLIRDARVWLFRRDPAPHPWSEPTVQGRFAISFPESGDYTLHVRAAGPGPGRGSARVELNGLRVSEVPRAIDVVLGGGSPLRGRIVDPDGAPVAGVHVLALPAGQSEVPSKAAFAEFERAGGLWGGVASTNASGAFEIPAVAPAAYDFHVSWTAVGFGYNGFRDGIDAKLERFVSIGSAAFDPLAAPIELVFATRRVEVRLRGPNGTFTPIEQRGIHDRLKLRFLPGERFARLMAREIGPFSMSEIVAGDVAVFPSVEPRAAYLATWTDSEYALVERVVQPDAERFCRRVELDIGPRFEPAKLRVHVTDPSGKPAGGAGTGREIAIVVETVESRAQLALSYDSGTCAISLMRDGFWSVALPPGRVRVRAIDQSAALRTITADRPLTEYAPASAIVELEPGDMRDVDLRLGVAGALRFDSKAHRPFPDLELLGADIGNEPLAGEPPIGSEPDRWFYRAAERQRLANGGGFASLVGRDGQGAIELRFQASAGQEFGWVAPGRAASCVTPLPPGRWMLRVEDGEQLLFEQAIVIRAGETTVVSW